jgi:hypothetical protein
MDDQPWIDAWPLFDEALSKLPVPLDIVGARWRLAKRFNARLPAIPAAVREREVDRAWDQHRRAR